MNKVVTIPETLSIHIPFQITKRGGPQGDGSASRCPASAPPAPTTRWSRRWRELFAGNACWKPGPTPRCPTLRRRKRSACLAEKEKIGLSYLTRVLRMTLLAPDIVDAILNGRQGDGIDLAILAAPFPNEWDAQRRHFGIDA